MRYKNLPKFIQNINSFCAFVSSLYRNFVFLLFVFSSTTLAFELTCRYKTNTDWWAINDVYFCDLKFDLDIAKSNDVVTTVSGNHLDGKSNSDVVGFRASNKKLLIFPAGLDKYFDAAKIEFIAIWSTGLKEIHQSDLAPFKKMRILSLWDNDFEVIERDLLEFNPHIEYIGLGKNRIKFVDGNVFGHLKKLHTLHIDGNACISRQVAGDRSGVLNLLDEIKEKCEFDNEIGSDSDLKFDVRFNLNK